MATNFPTSLDNLDPTRGAAGNKLSSPNHVTHHTNEDDAIEALQAKVGVNSSAVTTSLDYKLTNASSSNPGHKHTLANGATDVTATFTELNYVDGVTSNIQTQLDAKQARSTLTTKGDLYVATASATVARQAVGTDGYVLTADSAQTNGITWSAPSTFYAADAGSNDTYVITLSPALGSYTTGQIVRFKANTANTGAATLNVNSLGAKTIKKRVDVDLDTNDIKANQLVEVIYDGTNFQLLSQISNQISLYASGNTTYDLSTASGTVNVAHGLGVTPKAYKTIANSSSGFSAASFNGNYTANTDGSANTPNVSSSSYRVGFSNGNYQTATISADATNIIFTWTKTGTPTGNAQIIWEAFV